MVVVVCESFLRIAIATKLMAAVSQHPAPEEEEVVTCEASMQREEITTLRYLVVIVADTAKVEARVEVAAQVLAQKTDCLSSTVEKARYPCKMVFAKG